GLAIYSQQRCVQRRDGRITHLDRHAVGHASPASLAAFGGMKILLTTMVAMLMLSLVKTRAADATQRPEFKLSRQDEDWSVLRDPGLRTELLDGIKFVPLDLDGSSWLTLGGEARERYEYFQNANWGRGPQDDDGYLLH